MKVTPAKRVQFMAVGNLAWCIFIDHLAHRQQLDAELELEHEHEQVPVPVQQPAAILDMVVVAGGGCTDDDNSRSRSRSSNMVVDGISLNNRDSKTDGAKVGLTALNRDHELHQAALVSERESSSVTPK
jgi:hypothetical protein